MRKINLKKWAALLLALLVLPWGTVAQAAALAEPAEHTVEQRVLPFLFEMDDGDILEDEIRLYFVDDGDIPYVALSDYMTSFAGLMEKYDDWDTDFHIYCEITEGGYEAYYVHRTDNHSLMVVVPELGVISFDSFNLYTQKSGVSSLVTLMELPEAEELNFFELYDEAMGEYDDDLADKDFDELTDEDIQASAARWEAFIDSLPDPAEDHTFFVSTGNSFNRFGGGTQLELANYGIRLYSVDGECYIPLQTMNDLFMNTNYLLFIYNGQTVVGSYSGGSLLERSYEAEPEEMSEEYAAFNYSELLFLLDTFYGLKPEHGIDSFRTVFSHNLNIADALKGAKSQDFDAAMAYLLGIYLDDLHSAYNGRSWRTPDEDGYFDLELMFSTFGHSLEKYMGLTFRYGSARDQFYPDGVPGYEEVGDTAFITFDEFTYAVDELEDYYELGLPATLEECEDDTFKLIMYANQQIQRENTPIKNVVIDLSNNGGGFASAALVVICWYLGDASIALRDTMTDAMTIMSYKADLNLNEKTTFDDSDSLAGNGFNLYCLISPCSFSCGNLVPAAFRESGLVTLIGQRSGGGSCVVLPCTSASGTQFQISGTKQLAIVKNGSFYNIDDGIEPDIVLTKPQSFYDREALVELIHTSK